MLLHPLGEDASEVAEVPDIVEVFVINTLIAFLDEHELVTVFVSVVELLHRFFSTRGDDT